MPQSLLQQAHKLVPHITLTAGKDFFWSPAEQHITYRSVSLKDQIGRWALLHEVAHALLNHQSYQTDYELLLMEVAAWEKAQQLATDLDLTIDKEHIEDCLDTYRDWLHERSTCPTCSTVSLQTNSTTYHCHNCFTTWQVSSSRFCRPYRLRHVGKKTSSVTQATTFS